MPRADETFRIRDDGKSISYGPAHETLDAAYTLAFVSGEGKRVEVILGEAAMYELWVEVKGRPWPDLPDELARRDALLTELLELAQGADADGVREALAVLEERAGVPPEERTTEAGEHP